MNALLLLGTLCGVALAVALALSPGTPRPILDEAGEVVPGSIAEKTFVDVNGTRQGVFIRGRSTELPVLLYVHGGIPDYFLTARLPPGWRTTSSSSGGNSVARASPTPQRIRPSRLPSTSSSATRWN
jgi:hypothetical protein